MYFITKTSGRMKAAARKAVEGHHTPSYKNCSTPVDKLIMLKNSKEKTIVLRV